MTPKNMREIVDIAVGEGLALVKPLLQDRSEDCGKELKALLLKVVKRWRLLQRNEFQTHAYLAIGNGPQILGEGIS